MRLPGIRKYPKEVLVGKNWWKIKFVRKVPDGRFTDLLGLCDPSNKILYIILKQSRLETLKTFFHEVCHAIEDESELCHLDKEKLSYQNIHDHIEEMENGLASFFIDNLEVILGLFRPR